MLKPFLASFVGIVAALAPIASLAAATNWQEVATDARLRLVATNVLGTDGKTEIALELEMPDHMQTYWRIPGEAGVPTSIDISSSRGLSDPEIRWPFPQRKEAYGLIDYIYTGNTVLPVDLDVSGTNAKLVADIFMGVCSDICVPVSAKFELDLDFSDRDNAAALRITQAKALVPIAWDLAGAAMGRVAFDKNLAQLTVYDLNLIIDAQTMIVDNGDPAVLFGSPQKSPIDGAWIFELLDTRAQLSLLAQPVRLSFASPNGPYFVLRDVVGAKDADADI